MTSTGCRIWGRPAPHLETIATHRAVRAGQDRRQVLSKAVRVGRLRVTDLYLTVDDLEALGEALTSLGIAGRDLRTRR